MPLQSGDIKLFKSDTMNDTNDGGGELTRDEVVNGQSNNIFEDISTIDRVVGAVHMRKVYPSVDIQTTDKYFGAHTIISKLPKDEKIGINLFDTGDHYDRRTAAQTRVENYLAKGAKYTGFLYATQFTGSKVITIFQSVDAPVPVNGDVLYLTQNNDTEVQYVKVVDVTQSIQTFTVDNKTFQKNILTIEISASLEYDFIGTEINNDDATIVNAEIRTTLIANAAKYYSARPLSVAGAVDDLSVKVDTVYSQVIPSSTSELAIVDADASGVNTQLIPSSSNTSSFTRSDTFSANTKIYLGSPCLPSSLTITVSGGTLVDNGGNIKSGTTTVGSIDYNSGVVTFSATSPTYSGTKTISFTPAVDPQTTDDSNIIEVGLANRGQVYAYTLVPIPNRGSLRVSYRALGQWFTMYDNGSGGLIALEDGIGTGTINYTTGTITLTLASLPDVGSAIISLWGNAVNYVEASQRVLQAPSIRAEISQTADTVDINTITFSWNDGSARTAVTSIDGIISGDATGRVYGDYNGNLYVELIPTTLVPPNTTIAVAYDTEFDALITETFANQNVNGSGDYVLTLANTNIQSDSVSVQFNVDKTTGMTTNDLEIVGVSYLSTPSIIATYNGTSFDVPSRYTGSSDQTLTGLVNASTGVVTINPTTQVPVIVNSSEVSTWKGGSSSSSLVSIVGVSKVDAPVDAQLNQTVKVSYSVNGSVTSKTLDIITPNIELDLIQDGLTDESIQQGSVRFKIGSTTYIDRNGILEYDVSTTTGLGTQAGTIDYNTGKCVITDYPSGGSNAITVESLVRVIYQSPRGVAHLAFRIPSSPIRSQSFQMTVDKLDGTGTIIGTADANGDIVATGMEGTINYETGVVELRFGEDVVAAGNESAWWYDASLVESGNIFQPTLVNADTLRYNAVAQTFLPIDASILGLDPVRLPDDGRIPIYSDGDVLVILHDQETVGTYVNTDVVNFGRTNLASVTVADSVGTPILDTAYTVDLDLGTLTFDDVSGISQPITIVDRIEDMALVTDVQITGTLTLSQPLTHDYPVDETLVANALIHGDLFASVSTPFDQQTWTNEWSDNAIGNTVVAEFNQSDYPIVVDNASCIEERWALIFTSSTTVNVIGEHVGQVLSGTSINNTIAPINPSTAQPYFSINLLSWGAGWASGNVLRFNTNSASHPIWMIQSIGQGDATNTDADAHTFCTQVRGDKDA